MPDTRREAIDNLMILHLARGKGNALSGSLIEELIAALDDAARDDGIRGLILTSDLPGFFSTGLDVTEVFAFDRKTMLLFFSRFVDLYESLYLLPKPVVAAVSGHAYAGGAMLAVSCDVRLFARGKFRFAINEVDLGLVPPPGFVRILNGAVGPGPARELLLSGAPLSPERAFELGIANELAEPDSIHQRAIEICSGLAKKPPKAFAGIKRSLRDIHGHWSTDNDPARLDEFVDRWFSTEAEQQKRLLASSLAGRRTGE